MLAVTCILGAERAKPTMTTIFGSDVETTHPAGPDAEERSIGEALRITMLFVLVVLILLWAGLADAGVTTDSSVRAAGPDAQSSSPTLR
jgi:hypothetical protein